MRPLLIRRNNYIGMPEIIALKHERLLQCSGKSVRETVAVIECSRMSSFAEAAIRGTRKICMFLRNRHGLNLHSIQEEVEFFLSGRSEPTLNDDTRFQKRSSRQPPETCGVNSLHHSIGLGLVQKDCNDGRRIQDHKSLRQPLIIVAYDGVWRLWILHRETSHPILNALHLFAELGTSHPPLFTLKALTQRLHNRFSQALARKLSQIARQFVGFFVFDLQCHDSNVFHSGYNDHQGYVPGLFLVAPVR